MIRFLPSYVGSKKYWVSLLQKYNGEDFVEPFCGSAVLSANLAKTAILNDLDSKVYEILKNFDQLIVPEIFTCSDFERFKSRQDWWKWSYCLQKMSFSGVFRYSKNGYNVPIKKDKEGKPAIKEVRIQEEFDLALTRWKELNPIVTNKSYDEIDLELLRNKIVVLDPPYENSQASYNSYFDYNRYWNYVDAVKEIAKAVIIFDTQRNLTNRNIPIIGARKMKVNGGKDGNVESVGIFENGKWQTDNLGDCVTFIPEESLKAKPKDVVIKKRGRPKGSKNKLKNSTELVPTELVIKRGRGRPKGSKNKPKVVI